MKTIIIIFFTNILIVSCQSLTGECNKIVEKFNYPEDIEILSEKNYICKLDKKTDKKRAFYNDKVETLFSDLNYTLIAYNDKTRVLEDRLNNIIIVFKATESGNFNYKDKSRQNKYGLNNIYILDKDYMPLFSFNEDHIYYYRNSKQQRTTYYSQIELTHKIKINLSTFTYEKILGLSKNLLNGNYRIIGKEEDSFFYNSPPIWLDI